MNNIAPSYQMKLIEEIKNKLWERYTSYKNVKFYLKKFQEEYWNGNFLNGFNFEIIENDSKIDLESTLHGIDGGTLIKIAIDLEVETPDFIPSFPVFKNVVKENKNLKSIFDVAFKNIEENPSLSISNSNSALESICKNILKKYDKDYNGKETLQTLVEKTLKLFSQYPSSNQDKEIIKIGSGLIKVAQAIENLRSNKTTVHGKHEDDILIEDSLYSYFVINAVSTIGLYIDSFYKKKFIQDSLSVEDDLQF
jgi:hypothetical protein